MKFKLLTLGGIGLLIACTPTIDQRGYLADPDIEASLKTGTDTKTSIQDRLGYASTVADFGGDAWYYISATEKQVAFFTPTVLDRKILAVYFDKSGKVTAIRHFGLQDGHVISFEARETPARGRELTFLQQLLNATPGSGQSGMQQSPNPGGGGGGGPPPTTGGGGGLALNFTKKARTGPPSALFLLWPALLPRLREAHGGGGPYADTEVARDRRVRIHREIRPYAPAPPAAAAPRCW